MHVGDLNWWLWHGGLWLVFSVILGILALYWHVRAKRAEEKQRELHNELTHVAALLANYRTNYYGGTGDVIEEIIARLSNSLPRFGAIFKADKP